VAQGDAMNDALAREVANAKAGEVKVEQDPTNADRLVLAAPVLLADSQGAETRVGTIRMAYDASALAKAKQEAIAEAEKRAADAARRLLIFASILLAVGVLLAGWQSVQRGTLQIC
jgi:hypothetical protein